MTEPMQYPIGLSPYLQIGEKGAAAAIDFYKAAFAAEEIDRRPAQDGKRLMHAALRVNGGIVLMCDSFPEYGHAPKEPAAVVMHLQVEDADAWWDRAIAAGGAVVMPMDKQFWGDRYGQLKDPFGFTWSIGGPDKG